MNADETQRVIKLSKLIDQGGSVRDAIARTLGGSTLCGGFVRFFAPSGMYDITQWNDPSLWKRAWSGIADPLFAFAEDCFGNQFGFVPMRDSVVLWSHEDGQYIDSELDALTLLRAIAEHGLDWVDFYRDDTLDVFRKYTRNIPNSVHLHWTQPLVLGGSVSLENVSTVERVQHLIGHGQIWKQMQGLSPGDEVVWKITPTDPHAATMRNKG